jgi:hypothetical protein
VHPTAKRCIAWAVGCLLGGAVLLAYGPNVYASVARVAGANAEAGLGLLNLALTLVDNLLFPLGAVLIGAAVVIQTLGGDRDERTREAAAGGAPDADPSAR